MIFVKKRINLKPGQTLWVRAVGDVHYNTDECDRERLQDDMERDRKRIRDGNLIYGVGIGDYNDPLSPSERAAVASAKQGYGLHDTTLRAIDREAKRITERFHRATRHIPFIGLCEGHHFMTFSGLAESKLRGLSTTEYLCQLKHCMYLGTLGVIDLSFPHGKRLRLVITHGYGGARTAGARVIKRVRMAEVVVPSCDTVYLMGHDDELMAKGAQILDFSEKGRFKSTKVHFIGTGSYQRAYHFGRPIGDYVEQLMLPPAQLGCSLIMVQLTQRNRKWHLDWNAVV